MRYFIIILCFHILLSSCSERQTAIDNIEDIESAMNVEGIGGSDSAMVASAIKAYEDFILEYPKDSLVPVYHFKVTLLQLQYQKKYEEVIARFTLFQETYPGHRLFKRSTTMLDTIERIKQRMIDKVKAAEEDMSSDSASYNFNKDKVKALINAYKEFSDNFSNDQLAPEYIFDQAIMYYRNLNMAKEALAAFEMVNSNYPDYKKLSDCLFWIGYIYDNDFNDLEKAEKYYTIYLEKFPNHELNQDVTFLLDHLGMSDEEILQELLQNSNGAI